MSPFKMFPKTDNLSQMKHASTTQQDGTRTCVLRLIVEPCYLEPKTWRHFFYRARKQSGWPRIRTRIATCPSRPRPTRQRSASTLAESWTTFFSFNRNSLIHFFFQTDLKTETDPLDSSERSVTMRKKFCWNETRSGGAPSNARAS